MNCLPMSSDKPVTQLARFAAHSVHASSLPHWPTRTKNCDCPRPIRYSGSSEASALLSCLDPKLPITTKVTLRKDLDRIIAQLKKWSRLIGVDAKQRLVLPVEDPKCLITYLSRYPCEGDVCGLRSFAYPRIRGSVVWRLGQLSQDSGRGARYDLGVSVSWRGWSCAKT